MKRLPLLTFVLFFLFVANQFSFGQDCNKLPESFPSHTKALQLIKSSTFKFHESVNTSTSSWIRGADYFSCDGQKGFLIIKTDDRDYIQQKVPIDIWNGFKKAGSFGSYYTNFIKGNYRLLLKY